MDIVDRLLNSIEQDAPVQQIVVGAFWTAVVVAPSQWPQRGSVGKGDPPRCGLASTLHAEEAGPWPPVVDAGQLLGRSGRELAGLLRSERILEASIGMAALNALLRLAAREETLPEVNAEEIIVDRGTGRRVAVVGHFPFIERVRAKAAECWVLERNPSPGDLPASAARQVLPEADVVALTGTSLLNHTFEELLGLCRPDAFVLLLGPSTPLSPLLLETGLDGLSGTRVDEPERVLLAVSQGATFRQVKRNGGLRLLTMLR
jgi:hypothetical protein